MTPRLPSDAVAPTVSIADVRFEHLRETLGVGNARPRLSWLVDTTIPGWRQAS